MKPTVKLHCLVCFVLSSLNLELFLLPHHRERTGHHSVAWRRAEQWGDGGGSSVGEGGGGLREGCPVVDKPRRTGVRIGGGQVSSIGLLRHLLLAGGTGKYGGVLVNYSLVIQISQVSLWGKITLIISSGTSSVILLFLFLQVIMAVFLEDTAL